MLLLLLKSLQVSINLFKNLIHHLIFVSTEMRFLIVGHAAERQMYFGDQHQHLVDTNHDDRSTQNSKFHSSHFFVAEIRAVRTFMSCLINARFN